MTKSLTIKLSKIGKVLRKLFILTLVCTTSLIIGIIIFSVMYSEPMKMYPDRIKGIKISSPIPVVPGNCLPKNLTIMSSNNNVDLIKVGKSIYMCFRTAPTHFASSKTLLHIMRSDDDGKTWQKELSINMGRDLREPRFLYFKDRLFVYFYTGGTHPLKFEPSYIHFCERINNMQWTEPQPIFEPGYVVWRIRSYGDTAYMSVYYGLDIYGKGNRGEIRLLKSSNGLDWEPISNEPQISIVGAEEAEFMFDENGGIIAIVRLEVTGGALICRATADNLAHWECKRTSYKVDSSLMFKHDKRYFVVGRRNIAGRSTREYWNFVPTKFRNAWNMVFYSLTRKRTCLYEINPDTLELYPLIDLPSKGDTAFAGIVQISKDKYYLVNYSSPLEGFDLPWIAGQIFGSRLYGFIIDLSEVN